MTTITAITGKTQSPSAIIFGVTPKNTWQSAAVPPQAEADVHLALSTLAASSTPETVTPVLSSSVPGHQLFAVHLGETPDCAQLRRSAGSAMRHVTKNATAVIDLPHATGEEFIAIAEGALLGAYQFNEYRSHKAHTVDSIGIVTELDDAEALLTRARILADAQNSVRDMVNTPAGDLRTTELVAAVEKLVANTQVSAQVWDEAALKEAGCGGILGVGQGSTAPARLMRLEWNPQGASHHIALVGKGITFDSGGMSLKTHDGLINMKTDMTGAATVAATIWAAAELNINVRMTAWLCIAENMLSGSATRIGDVLTISNGTTVEVNNTDAEGRLVLADGLTQALRESPDEVIDVATLTGAQIVALGLRCAGLMGTKSLTAQIASAANSAGEDMWQMPLPAHLVSSLKSDVADTKNSGTRPGGMLVAGLFLQKFVGTTPWAHIDIAGPSFNTEETWGYTPKGATGFAVRTLVAHALSQAK